MTVKRKGSTDGVLEEVSFGRGTITFRGLLIIFAFCATPPGQQLLKGFGITAPASGDVVVMQKSVEDVRHDISMLTGDVASVKSDIAALKIDVAAVKAKSDKLDLAVTGFQIDFAKYKEQHP